MRSIPQGSPTLFDGKICSKCGVWFLYSHFHRNQKSKDGHYAYCKVCTRDVRRRYDAENRQHVTEYQRAYQLAHRRSSSNKIRLSPEEIKKKNVARTMAWRRAHPDKVSVLNHQRRARIVGTAGSYTAAEWNDLCASYNWCCLACGVSGGLTVDHVVPLARGGANTIDNIQPLCRSCNNTKATKTIDYRVKYDDLT